MDTTYILTVEDDNDLAELEQVTSWHLDHVGALHISFADRSILVYAPTVWKTVHAMEA